MEVGVNDERAQVILIGAFLIAIGVLAALLILNDVGFSQTIAKQDGGGDGFESLEFSDSAEVAVYEAMAGNGTTPSNASVEFKEYIESYSNQTNDALLSGAARVNVTPDTSNLTTAWMVGQRSNGTFENAKGDDKWIMVENIPSSQEANNIRGRYELNVTAMSAPNPDPFILKGTEEGDFDSLIGLTGADAWRLEMRINDSTGDDLLKLNLSALENTTALTSGLEVTNSGDTTTNVTGNETVTVDVFNETVNGDSSAFPSATFQDGTNSGDLVDPDEADGFKFKNGSDGIGTYEFRFFNESGSGVSESNLNSSSTNEPKGPCTHPDGLPCRSADGTEKHIVGIVHNVTGTVAELEYVSRSTSYKGTIGTAGGMTLNATDVNLNQIENVDGAASFNIEILATNSPVQENPPAGSDAIKIEYKVENTGTEGGTQDINLTIPAANPNPSNINNSLNTMVDAGQTLNSDTGSGIKNVTWEGPPVGENGTYTAFVRSVNSTTGETTVDSTVISVDKDTGAPGIPDSPVGFALPWNLMAEAFADADAEGVPR